MKGIRIRPDREGLRVSLFDLEADVMEVVWSVGWETFTVADVHQRLEASREIAYTTVMTTVGRLHEKGLLERERDGKRYRYRPVMDRDTFLRQMAREVFECLVDAGLPETDALEALLAPRVAEADGDELDRLEALIRARREELGE
jgi:predicted transcriptional regulator